MSDILNSIRAQVALHKGANVFYRAANGRRKAEARQGVIMDVYPNVFTLYVESQNTTVSFSYKDLLTREVELRLLPHDGEEDKQS